jgi:uncharacterized protein (TIGR02271 family)
MTFRGGSYRKENLEESGAVDGVVNGAGFGVECTGEGSERQRVGCPRGSPAGMQSKNVRTDRESIEVPTRHEEVSVERVPLSGEAATEAEIGEDEVSVPVTEEEVVVEKRPVVKEEVRIKKDVVEDTEVVEEDVRREEIDIDDETSRRNL